MAKIIGLPKLSPTMEEGTLARWNKQEGDRVDVDELLAEIETDKATMEFRSFDRGVIRKILASEGETLGHGTPMLIIGKKDEDVAELVEQAQRQRAGEEAVAPAEPEEGGLPDTAHEGDTGQRRTRESGRAPKPERGTREEAAALAEEGRTAPATQGAGRGEGGRILASPVVRKMAREHGIDLAQLSGSGPRGRIIKRDVDEALQAGKPAAPATGERPPPQVEKASRMRQTIARRLVESKQQVPHYYLHRDIDATPLVQARRDINAQLESSGEKVSFNDLIIKGCATALRRMPEVNVSWIEGEIHRHQRVDISVAVAVPEGLVAPVIRDADHKGVADIAREAQQLAQRARDKKLMPEEMMDGTFSVSNLGMFGIDDFYAVINLPEGAILAVGGIRDEPVVKGDQVVPGQRLALNMSCDHRVIDGAVGAQWLKLLAELLEHPATLAM